jgi:membrane protein implicated in regulation of membrane protease activity
MYSLINVILAASNSTRSIVVALIVIFVLVFLVYNLIFLKFFKLWLQAKLSRADVNFFELIGMTLRKVDTRTIVLCKITAVQAGLTLTTQDLESHFLAGGNVAKVVRAMILAKRKKINLSWEDAATIDMEGRDVFREVQSQGYANEGQQTEERPLCFGDVGRALSTIKNSGQAEFGETIADVVSQGEFIDEGSKVEIVEIDGDKIIVRPVHY